MEVICLACNDYFATEDGDVQELPLPDNGGIGFICNDCIEYAYESVGFPTSAK